MNTKNNVSRPVILALTFGLGTVTLSAASGCCPMPMGDGTTKAATHTSTSDAVATSMPMKAEVLSSYVKVSASLAADDLASAKAAAAGVAEHAGMADNKDLAAKANAVAKAADINAARDAFKSLSAAVEPLAKGEKDYVVMHCPMAGDWVQTKGPTRNPYMGKAMLTCGGPK